MGKWFDQAREIEVLRAENTRLQNLVLHLQSALGPEAADINAYGVSDEERALVSAGKQVEAIKRYRERTGAGLLAAKNAIDSVA